MSLDRLRQIIEENGLREDEEHVVIPYTRADGERRWIHLLKRPWILVRRGREKAVAVAVDEVVEALLREPEGSLWELLGLENRSEVGAAGPEEAEDPAAEGEDRRNGGSAPAAAAQEDADRPASG